VNGLAPGDPLPGFPAVWLRHNCPCPDCRDPVTGQRLIEISSIPNECGVTVTADDTETVTVAFAPDGHPATFSRAWLAAHALPAPAAAPVRATAPAGPGRSAWLSGLAGVAEPDSQSVTGPPADRAAAGPALEPGLGLGPGLGLDPDPRTEDGKRLWRAADLAGADLPGAAWASYLADDAVRAACLDAVATRGFALLTGVPAEPGTVLRVAETFGYVRETNYGRLFDVRVVADPANLAFTSRAIPPHTDNPYRDPVPTLQLLHCLRDADLGGDTGLVDGFAAAAALRAADPAAFHLLSTVSWPFAYADADTELRAHQPLMTLTPAGRVTAVRLNNRSLQPLRRTAPVVEAAYAAYRTWTALLARPEFTLTLRLAPGDCLVFDNTRVLHTRTAFTAAPVPPGEPGDAREPGDPDERHLQGCYADLDGLLSTLAVLRRARPRG
jgi:gamma-butyrobetaine dioxygenase